jgi:hypothetical protein
MGDYLYNYRYRNNIFDSYPVFPSFTKTLAALAEAGYTEDAPFTAEDIARVKVYASPDDYWNQTLYPSHAIEEYEEYTAYPDFSYREKEFDDPEDIAAILAHCIPSDALTYNPLLQTDMAVELTFRGPGVFDDDWGYGYDDRYDYNANWRFRRGEVPAFVRAALNLAEAPEGYVQ